MTSVRPIFRSIPRRVREGFEGLRLRDPALPRLLRQTQGHTLLAREKRIVLHRQARRVLDAGAQGAFCEIGVHRGGGIGMLAPMLARAGREIHLFDRWGDLPESTPEDGEVGEAYAHENIPEILAELRSSDPQAAAADLLTGLGFPRERLHLHRGWFDDTFPAYDGPAIAFAHVDADWYESMKTAFGFLEEHLADRAVVVIDDLGDWPGVELALEEFLAATARDVRVERLPSSQAVCTVGPL